MKNLRGLLLKNLKNCCDSSHNLSMVYYHLFMMLPEEKLEQDLNWLYNLKKGDDTYFKESGKDNWFAIWHKTIRQSDYFNACLKEYKIKLLTDDEKAKIKFFVSKIADGTLQKESPEADKLFTDEYTEYLNLQKKSRAENVNENIGGHLDMILWETIHVDENNFLRDEFSKIFNSLS